jgi:hypothetical protein
MAPLSVGKAKNDVIGKLPYYMEKELDHKLVTYKKSN